MYPFNISLHSLYLNSILFLFLLWYIAHSFSTLFCGVNIPTMVNFQLPVELNTELGRDVLSWFYKPIGGIDITELN